MKKISKGYLLIVLGCFLFSSTSAFARDLTSTKLTITPSLLAGQQQNNNFVVSNLLPNPGFENGFNSWWDQYGFPATISPIAHSGLYSAKKSIGVISGQDYYSQLFQDIFYNANHDPYPLNTPVYATAYIKTIINPVAKSKSGLQLEFIDSLGRVIRDGNNNPIVVKDEIGGQTDWRYLYATRGTPAGTVAVRVGSFIYANRGTDSQLGGDAYFDDFQFSLTPLPLPPAKTNLLNAGFENGVNDWKEDFNPSEVSATTKRTGNYAGRFLIPWDYFGGDYFGSLAQEVPVDACTRVSASIWIKTVPYPGRECEDPYPLNCRSTTGLSIEFLDQNGVRLGQEYKTELPLLFRRDWTQVSLNNLRAPERTKKLKFSAYVFGDLIDTPFQLLSSTYFDDAFLYMNRKFAWACAYPVTDAPNRALGSGIETLDSTFGSESPLIKTLKPGK